MQILTSKGGIKFCEIKVILQIEDINRIRLQFSCLSNHMFQGFIYFGSDRSSRNDNLRLSVGMSIRWSVCLSICLSVCLSIPVCQELSIFIFLAAKKQL